MDKRAKAIVKINTGDVAVLEIQTKPRKFVMILKRGKYGIPANQKVFAAEFALGVKRDIIVHDDYVTLYAEWDPQPNQALTDAQTACLKRTVARAGGNEYAYSQKL